MERPVKYTDLLVKPQPIEYNLLPYIQKQKNFTFEQEDRKILSISPIKHKRKPNKKPQYDNTQYVPLEIVPWEEELYKYLQILDNKQKNKSHNKHLRCIKDDLPLKLYFEDLLREKWDLSKKPSNVVLHLQDPNLVFTTVETKRKHSTRYNLSNDKYYITSKKHKKQMNLSQLGVQHSAVALKLVPMFYKTVFTNEELKNFHRVALYDLCDKMLHIKFDKLNTHEKSENQLFKNAEELTINDGCCFAMLEYCEEYPLMLSNTGMVSVLERNRRQEGEVMTKIVGKPSRSSIRRANAINRENIQKLSEEDLASDECNQTEKAVETPINSRGIFVNEDLGLSARLSTNILKPDDPSPFIFDIKPGKGQITLSNNLYKAPCFESYNPDNLFLMSMSRSDNKNYIHPIPMFLTVPQVFPLCDVFSPHSKCLNTFCKNRLKFSASGSNSIRIKDLDEMFPTFSEGSKRKWLKEHNESKEVGEAFVTPENACQWESMLVGEMLYKEELIDSEMTPWNLTRNFLKSNMIEVTGRGDPIGYGFSFLKGFKENVKEAVQNRWDDMQIGVSTHFNYNNLSKAEMRELVKLIYPPNSTEEENFEEKEQPTRAVAEDDIRQFSQGIKIIRMIDGIEEIETIEDKDIILDYLLERKRIVREEKKVQLKCGNCGQIGHMKTNKTCPNYIDEKKLTKKRKDALLRRSKNILCEHIIITINSLIAMPHTTAFHKPVNIKKFPNYVSFVTKPIDLQTMRGKARQHKYQLFIEFVEDLKLMQSNCIAYNGPEHSFTKVAEEMVEHAKSYYRERMVEIDEIERRIKIENS